LNCCSHCERWVEGGEAAPASRDAPACSARCSRQLKPSARDVVGVAGDVLAAGLPKKFAIVSAGENMSIPFSETGREWVPPVSVTQSNACATCPKNLFSMFFQYIKIDQGEFQIFPSALRLHFLPRPGGWDGKFCRPPGGRPCRQPIRQHRLRDKKTPGVAGGCHQAEIMAEGAYWFSPTVLCASRSLTRAARSTLT